MFRFSLAFTQTAPEPATAASHCASLPSDYDKSSPMYIGLELIKRTTDSDKRLKKSVARGASIRKNVGPTFIRPQIFRIAD